MENEWLTLRDPTEDVDTETLAPVQRSVLAVLRGHIGRKNPITSEEITRQVGIESSNTNPVTRNHILTIIAHGVPVLSCEDGYFIAEREAELTRYLNHLDQRIDGMLRRKRLVRAAYYGGDA